MNLLIVVPAYAPFVGGAQTFCRAIARRLVADGHRVTVLTTTAQQADDFWQQPALDRATLPERESIDDIQIVRIPLAYPWPAPWRFGLLRKASHQLARLPLPTGWQKPLLRHLTRSMPPLLGLQLELLPLIDAADTVLDVDASWDGLFVGAAQAAFSQAKPLVTVPLIHTGSRAITAHFCMAHQVAVYQQSAATVALSLPEKRLLAEWGVEKAKLHRLSMGVEDVPTGETSAAAGSIAAGHYQLPKRFVLFLGAATYDKGAFTLALALVELARQGDDVAVVFCGPQQHQLTVFIDTQPADVRAILKERIFLLGVVDEGTKQGLLAGCVALALPSRVDSFGIVLLEAWQQSKPVIAAAIGGPAAIITHEGTGLLIPFDAPTALAAAIRRILNEPGLAARLGANGRQVVTDQYTWDKCYDALHQIFKCIHSSTDNASSTGSANTDSADRRTENKEQNSIGRSDERL